MLHRYMLGKKFLALEVWRKNILTENQITHTRPPPPSVPQRGNSGPLKMMVCSFLWVQGLDWKEI